MSKPTKTAKSAKSAKPAKRLTTATARNAGDVWLIHVRLVRCEEHVRSFDDRRYRITSETHEYRDLDGIEYRKSFEAKDGQPIEVPTQGTNREITARAIQWTR